MKRVLYTVVWLGAFLAAAAFLAWDEEHPQQCVETAQVESILEAHRIANKVRLKDGRVIQVSATTPIHPGDTYCVVWGRK